MPFVVLSQQTTASWKCPLDSEPPILLFRPLSHIHQTNASLPARISSQISYTLINSFLTAMSSNSFGWISENPQTLENSRAKPSFRTHTRREHNKSRGGCRNCRKRRIKVLNSCEELVLKLTRDSAMSQNLSVANAAIDKLGANIKPRSPQRQPLHQRDMILCLPSR